MKPKSWRECPSVVMKGILWNCDLEYDTYESSKVEAINDIQCGNVYTDNEKIINTTWAMLTEEDFQLRCRQSLEGLETQAKEIRKFLV